MAVEDIKVVIKSVAEIKALTNTVHNLKQLKRIGQDVAKPMATVEKRMKVLGVNTKKAGIAFQGFQMEMLSVLFFGMAMSRFLTSLIKPAFDLIGTFDILNTMLGAAFVPTAEKVTMILVDWLAKFGELDVGLRETIGWFILLLAALATAFMLFGMISLGLAGMSKIFGATIGVIAGIVGWIILLTGAVGWTIILFKNWEKHIRNIKYATVGTFGVLAGMAFLLGNPVSAAILGVLALLVLTKQAIEDYSDSWGQLNKTMDTMEPFREHYKPLDDFLKILEKIIEAIKTIGRFFGLIGPEPPRYLAEAEAYRGPTPPYGLGSTAVTINAPTEISSAATIGDVESLLDKRDLKIVDEVKNLFRAG